MTTIVVTVRVIVVVKTIRPWRLYGFSKLGSISGDGGGKPGKCANAYSYASAGDAGVAGTAISTALGQ